MNLQPHQQCVVEELEALQQRTHMLSVFVNGDVYKERPEDERRLLVQQLYHMRHYANILKERIALWQ